MRHNPIASSRPKRTIRYLFCVVAIIAGSIVFAWTRPESLASFIRPRLQAALEEAFDAQVTLGNVYARFGFPSEAVVENITIARPGTHTVVTIDSARGEINLIGLLKRGRSLASLEIINPKGRIESRDRLSNSPKPKSEHRETAPFSISNLTIQNLALDIVDAKRTYAVSLPRLRTGIIVDNGTVHLREPSLQGSIDQSPIVLTATTLDTSRADLLPRFEDLSFTVGESAKVVGAHGGEHSKTHITLRHADLEHLRSVLDILDMRGFPASSGNIDAELSLDGDDEMRVTGTIVAHELSLLSSRMRTKTVNLRDVVFTYRSGRKMNFAGLVGLTGLSVRDGQDSYSTSDARGPMRWSYDPSAGAIGQGEAEVKHFGFSDSTTTIRRASGKLSAIQAEITPRGDTHISLTLDGSEITLLHPRIKVHGARLVHAPLDISIPLPSGYSVKGPVRIESGSITLLGRKLDRLDSTIDMLVSRPLKQFTTQRIDGRYGESPVSVSTDFRMLRHAYVLRKTRFSVADGNADFEGELSRVEGGSSRLACEANELSLKKLLPLLEPESRDSDQGVIKKVTASLKGGRMLALDSLSGEGAFEYIEEVNGQDSVFQRMRRAFKDRGKEDESSPDGVIRSDFTVSKRTLHLVNTRITRKSYSIEASGDVSFDGKLDGRGKISLLRRTGKKLGLGPLKVPVRIRGTVKDPSVRPSFGSQ